jgi:hypothetical protein
MKRLRSMFFHILVILEPRRNISNDSNLDMDMGGLMACTASTVSTPHSATVCLRLDRVTAWGVWATSKNGQPEPPELHIFSSSTMSTITVEVVSPGKAPKFITVSSPSQRAVAEAVTFFEGDPDDSWDLAIISEHPNGFKATRDRKDERHHARKSE